MLPGRRPRLLSEFLGDHRDSSTESGPRALFLIGVSLIYGATGTLNIADLAAPHPKLR
jgi:hypothetical protein